METDPDLAQNSNTAKQGGLEETDQLFNNGAVKIPACACVAAYDDHPPYGVDAADVADQDLAGTGRLDGKTTLVGNGRMREVIGQTTASPVLWVNAAGETTKAGRRPDCSRPRVGSNSVQIKSPASGT